MTKVVVLCGGDSDEREISLRSGAAVTTALQASGFQVQQLDPSANNADYEQLLLECDVVFPVLHGRGGEDGTFQRWLEERQVRFVGADSKASDTCFDKWRYKQLLSDAGLPVPRGEMVRADTLATSPLITDTFVLKPADGGSSVDTFIIRDAGRYESAAIDQSFMRHPQMLVEQLISGTEITVGVLLDEPLPVIEIVPPSDGEFDYENKYNGKTQELCPPQSVPADIQQKAQALALDIHRRLGIRDFSRTDIIIGPSGELWILETNTIPGMTAQSLLPKAAAAAGYPMPVLCKRLVEAALQR